MCTSIKGTTKLLDESKREGDRMNEGYFPTLIKENETYVVLNNKEDVLGDLVWNEHWGCYVFVPDMGTKFGPAFLANLVSLMIKLDVQKSKVKE